jgi:putative transposase
MRPARRSGRYRSQQFAAPAHGSYAFAESFIGWLRDECLNETLFSSLAHAHEALIEWDDYDSVRPQSSLGNLPPTTYAQRSVPVMQRDGSLPNTPVASPSLNGW